MDFIKYVGKFAHEAYKNFVGDVPQDYKADMDRKMSKLKKVSEEIREFCQALPKPIDELHADTKTVSIHIKFK